MADPRCLAVQIEAAESGWVVNCVWWEEEENAKNNICAAVPAPLDEQHAAERLGGGGK